MIKFVTTTCARDAHYAKALLASIHHFHPEAPIIVLADSSLPRKAIRLFRCFPNTEVLEARQLWESHKLYLTGLLTPLNVYFLEDCTRVLSCDADSILTAPIVEDIPADACFIPFAAREIDVSVENDRKLFCNWGVDLDQVSSIAPEFTPELARFWMQGSHYYVDTSSFPREELVRFLPHLNLRHSPNGVLRAGDQGLLNFIINKHYVGKDGFYCWEGATVSATHEQAKREMFSLCPKTGKIAGAPGCYFVHYIGSARRYTILRHHYGDLLLYFYRRFHSIMGKSVLLSECDRAFSTAVRKVISRLPR